MVGVSKATTSAGSCFSRVEAFQELRLPLDMDQALLYKVARLARRTVPQLVYCLRQLISDLFRLSHFENTVEFDAQHAFQVFTFNVPAVQVKP